VSAFCELKSNIKDAVV